MIERLATTLRALATASPGDLATVDGKRLIADCADVVRLELDCMQLSLTARQRDALRDLLDLLEDGSSSQAGIIERASVTCAVLDLALDETARHYR